MMTDDRYFVVPVSMPPREMENRGSRRKYWVLGQDGETEWLLKFPRPGTGEHWAEKVAAEVGGLMGVKTARVELARVGDQLATVCQSFLTSDDLDIDDGSVTTWFHGSDFLDLVMGGYDLQKIRPNQGHNVKNIIACVLKFSGYGGMNPMRWDAILEDLASYVLLDGLIGNTDRHHQNWMVAYTIDAGNIGFSVAPSFDHASSLGRELQDIRRERYLSSPTGVLDYIRRGRGGVFVDVNRPRAPSPLRLAQLIGRWRPDVGRHWFDLLTDIPNEEFESIINRVPDEFMSDTAREFASQVVITSRSELLRSIG